MKSTKYKLAERLVRIFARLHAGGEVTTRWAVERFEVSEECARRDINAVARALGLVIRRGKGKYYRLRVERHVIQALDDREISWVARSQLGAGE